MSTSFEHLTPVEVLALDKFKIGRPAREEIQPGTYPVSVILAVDGELTVGEDYAARISQKIPWRDLFWAALSRLPESERLAFVADVVAGNHPEVLDRNAEEIKKHTESVLEAGSIQICKGKVTCTLTASGIQHLLEVTQ